MTSLSVTSASIRAQMLGVEKAIRKESHALAQPNVESRSLRGFEEAIARIEASFREVGQKVSQIRDPSLEEDIESLSADIRCLKTRVSIAGKKIQRREGPIAVRPSVSTVTARETLVNGLLSDPNTLFCFDHHPQLPYLKGYPAIRECHCIDGFKREDVRTNIPDCRRIAEDAFIHMIQDKFPLSTHPEVFVCSISPGGCAEEAVVHAKLRALGRKVSWLLVDPIFGTHAGAQILRDFCTLTADIDGVEGDTKIAYRLSAEDLTADKMKDLPRLPDAFIAIDLGYFNESQRQPFFQKLQAMEQSLRSLPNPHIYLFADKRPLADVAPEDVISGTSGPVPYRPVVTIEYVNPGSPVQRKLVLGPMAWNRLYYDSAFDEKATTPSKARDKQQEEGKREVNAAAVKSVPMISTGLSIFDYLAKVRKAQEDAHAAVRLLTFPREQDKKAETLELIAKIANTATELMLDDDADESLFPDTCQTALDSIAKVMEHCRTLCQVECSPKDMLKATEGLFFAEWAAHARDLSQKARSNCTPEMVREFDALVLRYKDHINVPGAESSGGTILHWLGKEGKPVQFIEVLAKHGADFTLQDEFDGNTPILWAIANASMAMAIEMLKHGPKGSAAREYLNKKGCGNTALHLAVGKGQEGSREPNRAIARMIVDLGADIDMQNRQGNTALHLACLRRDPDMIQFLLERGAKTNLRNADGKTAEEMMATAYDKACEILAHTSPFSLSSRLFEVNLASAQEAYKRFKKH